MHQSCVKLKDKMIYKSKKTVDNKLKKQKIYRRKFLVKLTAVWLRTPPSHLNISF